MVTLAPYADAMRELAEEENVNIVDLNAQSFILYNHLGVEASKALFLILEPEDSPNYPSGIVDNTHFSTYGASQIARIVLSEIAKMNLPISKYLLSGGEITQPVLRYMEDWVHTDWTLRQKLRHGDLRRRLKSRQRC